MATRSNQLTVLPLLAAALVVVCAQSEPPQMVEPPDPERSFTISAANLDVGLYCNGVVPL